MPLVIACSPTHVLGLDPGIREAIAKACRGIKPPKCYGFIRRFRLRLRPTTPSQHFEGQPFHDPGQRQHIGPAKQCPRRDYWRRHRWLLDRLSPRQTRLEGCCAARTGTALWRHHMARSRPRWPIARPWQFDQTDPLLDGTLRRTGGRDRSVNRLEAVWFSDGCAHARPHDIAPSRGRLRARARRRLRNPVAGPGR